MSKRKMVTIKKNGKRIFIILNYFNLDLNKNIF